MGVEEEEEGKGRGGGREGMLDFLSSSDLLADFRSKFSSFQVFVFSSFHVFKLSSFQVFKFSSF